MKYPVLIVAHRAADRGSFGPVSPDDVLHGRGHRSQEYKQGLTAELGNDRKRNDRVAVEYWKNDMEERSDKKSRGNIKDCS